MEAPLILLLLASFLVGIVLLLLYFGLIVAIGKYVDRL